MTPEELIAEITSNVTQNKKYPKEYRQKLADFVYKYPRTATALAFGVPGLVYSAYRVHKDDKRLKKQQEAISPDEAQLIGAGLGLSSIAAANIWDRISNRKRKKYEQKQAKEK